MKRKGCELIGCNTHIDLTHDLDLVNIHDYVIKWENFPGYWPFLRGIHRSLVNSRHKGRWRKALMFPLICTRISAWVNNREAGDLRRHRTHYEVIVMLRMLCLRNGRVNSLRMKGMWVGYGVGCTMGLTLSDGAWQIDQLSNGLMWNSYSFQPVGPGMGYSFTDLGAEGYCHSLNALL